VSKVKVKAPKVTKATREVIACDQGHYGSTYCSNCHADVENHYKKCPKCGAIFIKTNYDSGSWMGGSDF